MKTKLIILFTVVGVALSIVLFVIAIPFVSNGQKVARNGKKVGIGDLVFSKEENRENFTIKGEKVVYNLKNTKSDPIIYSTFNHSNKDHLIVSYKNDETYGSYNSQIYDLSDYKNKIIPLAYQGEDQIMPYQTYVCSAPQYKNGKITMKVSDEGCDAPLDSGYNEKSFDFSDYSELNAISNEFSE